MRASARTSRGIVIAALAPAALLWPAAAEAQPTRSTTTPGPQLSHLTAKAGVLTLGLTCHGTSVSAALGGKQRSATCHAGKARVTLKLTAAQARSLATGRTTVVRAHVADARGAGVLRLPLAVPAKRALARASSGAWWSVDANGYAGPTAQCVVHGWDGWSTTPYRRSVYIESAYATFGYRYGTQLRWTAWLETFDAGKLSWFRGYTYNHVVGGGRGASHEFTLAQRPLYVRPALEIVGGSWNYVQIEAFAGKAQPYNPGGWCFAPVAY